MLKKILFLLSLCILGHSQSYFYESAQSMGGLAMAATGLRSKSGNHGLDLSVGFLPTGKLDPVIFHAKSQYLFYPIDRQGFYLGSGIGLLNEPESIEGVTGSFEPSLGYEWQLHRHLHTFVEINGIAPFQKPKGATRIWPGLAIGLGF